MKKSSVIHHTTLLCQAHLKILISFFTRTLPGRIDSHSIERFRPKFVPQLGFPHVDPPSLKPGLFPPSLKGSSAISGLEDTCFKLEGSSPRAQEGNTPCLTGELGEESLPHCSGALCD